jgi:hypothetical protein
MDGCVFGICRRVFGAGGRAGASGPDRSNSRRHPGHDASSFSLETAAQEDPGPDAELSRRQRGRHPAASQSHTGLQNCHAEHFRLLLVHFLRYHVVAGLGHPHPQLRSGIAGYGRYYWRGFLDKADGNYLVIFALPTVFHQDERYYAMGQGSIWKRGIYAASRVLITPNYDGRETFNASEIFGRAIAQGVSATYYPSQSRMAGTLDVKYGWAIGRDALTNVFREFWPDIAVHVLHRKP